jgi:hypothetical protein
MPPLLTDLRLYTSRPYVLEDPWSKLRTRRQRYGAIFDTLNKHAGCSRRDR